MILLLHRHNRHGLGNINLEIDDDSINYININYIDKNNEDIEKNKNNISTNLISISSNEDNIASNLSEIDYLKNNSTQYLKNVYNIYNEKTQINFKGIFFEKIFEVNNNKNDFIEMKLKSIYNMKIYQNETMSKLFFKYLMKMIIVYI